MKHLRWVLPVVALACVLTSFAIWFNTAWWWFEVKSGTVHEAGPFYGFYSGFGSIILPPILNAIAFGAIFWWHHQCHVHGCYLYARRTTAAGERACWRHHPHPKRTEADIHHAHHRALHLMHRQAKTSSDERNDHG